MIIWEKLTSFKILVSYYFLMNNHTDTIYYIDSTKLSKKILRFNTFFRLNKFINIEIGEISRKDTDGNSISYQAEELTWQVFNKFNFDKKKFIEKTYYEDERWLKIIQSWYIMKLSKKTEKLCMLNNYINQNFIDIKIKIYFDSFPIFKLWNDCMICPAKVKLVKWPNLYKFFYLSY